MIHKGRLPYWNQEYEDTSVPEDDDRYFICVTALDPESKRQFWTKLKLSSPDRAQELSIIGGDPLFRSIVAEFEAVQLFDVTDIPKGIISNLRNTDGSPVKAFKS